MRFVLKTNRHRRESGCGPTRAGRRRFFACALRAGLTAVFILGQLTASAAVTVTTLGGGRLSPGGADAGFADGDSLQVSQFNTPNGLALDAGGNLLIADQGNGAVRQLDVLNRRVSTVLTNLAQPVAVAVGKEQDLFIVTQGDKQLWKLDRFGNLSVVATGLESPSAVAIDRQQRLYVTEGGGKLRRLDLAANSNTLLMTTLDLPGGVAVLDSGLVAVSETGKNRIVIVNPEAPADSAQQIVRRFGPDDGSAGFRDGPTNLVKFNQPLHLAKAPNGSLLVADRLNHRVRGIDVNGFTTTLYGVDPSLWEGPECLDCTPIILPGWFDGSAEFAEAKEPMGVAVDPDGVVYASERGYHLIRQITGAPLAPGTGGGDGSGTNVVVLPPVLSPNSGYFPMGQTITVVNPNTNIFLNTAVYYTTDGTEPTTNSFLLSAANGVGAIEWRETLRDLTALRVRAFVGSASSAVVSGLPAAENTIGLYRQVQAGIGSTVVLPIVLNLRSNTVLRSLAYVVEITPGSAGMPPIPEDFHALTVNGTNDFIQVAGAAQPGKAALFHVFKQPTPNNGQRLAIAFVSTNSNFRAENFAVVGLLAVPVPKTGVQEHQTYSVKIVEPSATTETDTGVPLTPMSNTILLTNLAYTVGDTAPVTWYNAGNFGNGNIRINDANHAYSASLGIRTPYPFSDLFDAMDAYPEDTPGVAGGDGQIRFLDWQIILMRALRFETNNWRRSRNAVGERAASETNLNGAANSPALLAMASPGTVWYRQAALGVGSKANARPSAILQLPFYAKVTPGSNLSGLQFRVVIEGNPPLEQTAVFEAVPGIPALIPPPDALPRNEVAGAWGLSAFTPPLQRSNLLGYIKFRVPPSASAGDAYQVRFLAADGSPKELAQYEFETFTGRVTIGLEQPTVDVPVLFSDEWKIRFFGVLDSPEGQPEADPDGDGMPNRAEYVAGTDPIRVQSRLELFGATQRNGTEPGVVLRWLSAPGKNYLLETRSGLSGSQWSVLSTIPGTGQWQEWIDSTSSPQARFYRLRVQP